MCLLAFFAWLAFLSWMASTSGRRPRGPDDIAAALRRASVLETAVAEPGPPAP